MNSLTDRKMAMYRTVDAICKQHRQLIDSVPAFASRYAAFIAMLYDLDGILLNLSTDLTGISRNKNSLRKELSALCVAFSGALVSLCEEQGNYSICSEVRFSASALNKMSFGEVYVAATKIAGHALNMSAELQAYGINQEKIDALNTKLAMYHEILPSVEAARDNKKMMTRQLKNKIRETDLMLKIHMDKAARIAGLENPSFLMLYFNARKMTGQAGPHANNDTGLPANPELPPPIPA